MQQQTFSNRGTKDLRETDFPKPDAFYAPHAFWFWNGAFRTARIRSQAAGMCEQNLNPGYVHARFWPTPPLDFWMSEKWLDLFRNALEETARHGMHVTYTIGDPCFPDKYFLKDHPELAARSLEWTVSECRKEKPFQKSAEVLFAVAARRTSDGRLSSATFRKIESGWTPPDDETWTVFSFQVYTDPPTQYRNSYLDHRLFRAWCEVEHDLYEKTVSSCFGNVMRGIFVDQEGDWGYKMAYSEDLAEQFRQRAGYDIALALPLLIEEDQEGAWSKARWDWFDALSHCYMESFARPMTDWCRQRGMYMTCHYWEGDLYQQAMQCGSYFLMQRASSMPGTDTLFKTILTEPQLFCETASVCEWESRGNMSEILGIANWDLTPGELKDAAGAAVAWGITQPVLHGINTNPDIDRVSYPPDFYEWNPYWPLLHLWTTFTQRACWINDHGRLHTSILLLCPMDSVWALCGGEALFSRAFEHRGEYRADALAAEGPEAEIRNMDSLYQEIQKRLRFHQIDFLIADRHYFEEMTVQGKTLVRGDFAFDTVILPPLKLLPLSIARRLLDLVRAGGTLLATGSLPNASAEHGENDPELAEILLEIEGSGHFRRTRPELLPDEVPPSLRFDREATGILTTRRIIGRRHFLWISNNSGKPFASRLTVPGASGRAEYWNCETGTVRALPSQNLSGAAAVELSLSEHEAFWLSFDPDQPPLPHTEPEKTPEEILDLSRNWTIRLDPEKQVETGRGFLLLPDGIMRGRSVDDLRFWEEWEMKFFSGTMDYCRDFELESVTGTELLRLEQVFHTAVVTVNGQKAGERMWGPFEFRIGPWLKVGRNRIVISVGNLILNEILSYPHYRWKWGRPGEEKLRSGMVGRVLLLR